MQVLICHKNGEGGETGEIMRKILIIYDSSVDVIFPHPYNIVLQYCRISNNCLPNLKIH